MTHMTDASVNLDNADRFTEVLELEVDSAWPNADTRPGKTDRERREKYRNAAAQGKITKPVSDPLWWAFRINVEKANRLLDVDNVAKTVIDAFCIKQIEAERSSLTQVGLCADGTVEFVRVLQVAGAPGAEDHTRTEIFARITPEGSS